MFEHVLIPKPSEEGATILSAAFKAAMSAPNPSAATPALMEVLGKTFSAKRAYIYQLPPDSSEFYCSCEWSAPGTEPMNDITHGITKTMAARWFGDGNASSLLAIRNVKDVARVSPQYAEFFEQRNMKTQVLGKLIRGTHPMGVLGFDDPDPQKFDLLCGIMYPICAFAASTVNSQNLLGRIRSAGMVDKLTGAGTRLSFYQKAERLPTHLCVGMAYLDIAGLQGVNDVRGHDAGDDLLKTVRQILVTEFQDDQIFRMSGDEFLVMAEGMPEQPFYLAMTRIRGRLSELSTYVAVGTNWQPKLGTEYDSFVRHAWLGCSNDKREWERQGEQRLGDSFGNATDKTMSGANGFESESHMGSSLDIPCYLNDEFFRRAHIWMTHVKANRIALIALDINYFKLYNDIFGRTAGDMLLESYAHAINKISKNQHGLSGYLGGDNFALIFALDDDIDEAWVQSIIEIGLGECSTAEGFAPSAGIVITSELDTGMTILYDRAIVALQEVKGSYTNHVAFYDEKRYERERENQMLLIRAQEGLAKGEFTFFLQPKVDITNNKVVSAEALVRWYRDGELVPPFKFVEPMERSGYIFALDRYIWEAVCIWQRSLIDRGISPVPVSVNVSRVDFYFTDLATHFQNMVQRYDLPPRLIGVEITESAYSKDSDLIDEAIRQLQKSGFLVFMDDFGSGYSSLNMLRSVTVDVLKMDKGFIDHADIHNGSDAIISSVINMAHRMGLPVISEGVETEEQRDSLRKMDCDYVQGYYYYKPMTIEDFERILESGEAVELGHSDNLILALKNSRD